MLLPTSNKTASYGKRPLIKKGYYPAQLLKVEPYNDKDGKIQEGKYGHQLIFSFAIYQGDPDTGKPIKPMFHQPKEDSNEQENVILSKFVYHEYKDKKDDTKFQTAITPKSAMIKAIIKATPYCSLKRLVIKTPVITKSIDCIKRFKAPLQAINFATSFLCTLLITRM